MSAVLRPMRRPWRLLDGDVAATDWAEKLPHPTARDLRAAELQAASRRVLDRLPSGLLAALEEGLGEVWGPPPSEAGVRLTIEDGADTSDVVLTGPLARVGRGPSCHLALPDSDLEAEHCEISIEPGGLTVADLGSEPGTRLNGEALSPHEPSPAVPGDVLELGDHRLTVGEIVRTERRPAAVRRREIAAVARDPFADLPKASTLWVPTRVGAWRGFVALEEGWIESVYRGLGFPAPPEVGLASPVDRALTTFALQRLAADLGSRLGLPVEVGEPRPAERLAGDDETPEDGWLVAGFDVELDGRVRSATAVWASLQPASPPDPGWTREIPLTVSVLGGSASLTPAELADLESGDVIVPDLWLGDGETGTGAAGPALVAVQNWVHPGTIRPRGGRLELELGTPGWKQSPRGEAMIANDKQTTEAQDAGATPLDRDLEITLAFELDRLAVPLKDLAAWRPGATVALERSPSDPVRVLLIDGGGTRVVGSGTVVVVEDRLGVRLEQWRPEREGDGPA